MRLTGLSGINADEITELEKNGVSAEDIDKLVSASVPDLELDEEEFQAAVLFAKVQTQWNRGGMGDLASLDYAAVRVVAEITGVNLDSAMFRRIQIMEAAVLKEAQARGRRNNKPKRSLHR